MCFVGCMREAVRLATVLVVCLIASASVCAQTKDEKAASEINQGKAEAQATPQMPELAEATEMSAKVVKLYSEQLYDQALFLAKRVLEIRDKFLSPDDILIDEALHNLAEIYISENMPKEAEPFYLRMLAHYEKRYGPEHPKTAKIVERLAYISYKLDNFDESEKRILRALAIYEKAPGTSQELLASLTLQIAELYHVKKDYKKAEATYLRAIELSEQIEKQPEPGDGSETVSRSSEAYEHFICFLYETKGPGDAAKFERRFSKEREKAARAGKESNGEVLNGKAISLPRPAYPAIAKTSEVQGTVRVHVLINEQGEVVSASATCGPPLLRAAAVTAAYGARFTPTRLSGRPVKVSGVINYNFRLER